MKLVFNVPLGLDVGDRRKQIWPAVISAAGGLASSGLSATVSQGNNHASRVYNRWALNKQMEFQDYQSEKAREWEERMYNQYNSPSAMMEQYKAAGLNPYLGASSQTGSPMSGSAPMASSPGAGSPAVTMPDFSGLARAGDSFSTALGVQANIANQQAQTQETKWKTAGWISEHIGLDAAKKYIEENGLFGDPTNSLQSRLIIAEIGKRTEESLKAKVESGFIENYQKPQADAYTKQINKTVDKIDNEISVLKSQKDLNEASAYELGKRAALDIQQAAKAAAEAGTISDIRRYVVGRAALAMGLSGMEFLTLLGDFNENEYFRSWQDSDKAKINRKAARIASPEHNAVGAFIKGFGESIEPLSRSISPYLKRPSETYINHSPSWKWEFNKYDPSDAW